MTHAVWDPSAGDPREPGQPPRPATPRTGGAAHDGASFAAGQRCGTRVAACLARAAALDLVDEARWWNRGSRRRMARALLACADELESAADAEDRGVPSSRRLTGPRSSLRSV